MVAPDVVNDYIENDATSRPVNRYLGMISKITSGSPARYSGKS